MGYDLEAYVEVDQDAVDRIITEGGFNKLAWNDCDMIAKKYNEMYLNTDLKLFYSYNEKCRMHEISTMIGTNFIRSDERFSNDMYIRMLEKRHGIEFPCVLRNINWSVHNRKDAIEAAKGLETFFKDDGDLMWLASWLRETARFCESYELSY